MKYHFSSCETISDYTCINETKPKYILGSFHYLKQLSKEKLADYFSYINSKSCESFILDSGAFTVIMAGNKQKQEFLNNLDNYIVEYCNFIKKWNCKNYIELDLDSLIGYEKVKEITSKIEKNVGWQCMPVYHNTTRTKEDLDLILNSYKYICISNFNFKKSKDVFKHIKSIVLYAKSKGVKVHGLALTGKKVTTEIKEFYSIDSSSWAGGLRFGNIPYFCKKTKSIKTHKNKTNKKFNFCKENREKIIKYSIKQWMIYANYLDKGNK